MTETVLDIKHWGNNLGVRLPAAVARAARLHADQRVRITVEGERIIITPLHDEPLSLEQRLARFDPERHGGEAMSVDERLGGRAVVKRTKGWVPERQQIIWIDCNPQRGKEMRDAHPFLVLSPKAFNERTSLVIGLPMTTASYNADNPFAVAVGVAGGRKAGQTSYVLCHQPKSFDWRLRGGAPHPMKSVTDARFAEVVALLNQVMQLA